MLAIGAGAREESLRFIEQLGVRNILIDSRPTMSREEFTQRRQSSQGLNDRDVRILRANIEALEGLSPRKTLHPASVLPKPALDVPELYGVAPPTASFTTCGSPRARSSTKPTMPPAPRCACSGKPPRSASSATAPPPGKFVKVNDNWLEVVGVLSEQLRRRRAELRRLDAGLEQHRSSSRSTRSNTASGIP